MGEAWGEQEDLAKAPFIGQSGQELSRLLLEAGLARRDCLLTNVFPLRPPGNQLDALCSAKSIVGKDYPYAPIRQGKYIRPEYLPHLARLRAELTAHSRNLVVALGNAACWALLGSAGISGLRGVATGSSLVPGLKVLPTFHPAYVLRDWSQRVIVVADLLKAAREAQFPDIRRPERWVLVNPTLHEVRAWFEREAHILAVDIETSNRQITHLGFARSRQDAICIPFVQWNAAENSYWSFEDEVRVRQMANAVISGPLPKVTQNGLYDTQYLWREGFRPRNFLHDTMLLHHSLFPELQKGLGFLGSIYSSEASWKLMRRQADSNKRDE